MADSNVGTTVEAIGGIRPLLEEVKRRITAHPHSYSQDDFCGMTCCIGGHIDVILNGEQVHRERMSRRDHATSAVQIEMLANAALGVKDRPWLFDPADEWPFEVQEEYYDAKDEIGRSAAGCHAIDLYLEERGL